jgi:hypothetical protein
VKGRVDNDLPFQPRQRCTQTEARPLSEGKATIFLSRDIEPIGMIELKA